MAIATVLEMRQASGSTIALITLTAGSPRPSTSISTLLPDSAQPLEHSFIKFPTRRSDENSSTANSRDPTMSSMLCSDRPASSSDQDSREEKQTQDGDATEGGLRASFVAAGAACIFFSTLGLANSFGTFEQYYLTHQLQDHSPSAISWIGSLQSFLQFFAGMLGGPLFDRYGCMVIYPSAFLFTVSIMLLSLCTTYTEIMIVQGAFIGSIMGFLQLPAFAAVSQHFERHRAAALGFAVSGASLGGIVLPTLLSKLLNASPVGFGWAVRIIGFVILPLMLFAIISVKPRHAPLQTKVFLWTAYKEPRFVMLFVSLFFVLFGSYTPWFYLPTYAVKQGMKDDIAGYLLAAANAASALGRIIPGVLADRFGKLNTFAIGSIATGLAVFCMSSSHSTAALITYAVFLGFASGTNVSGASAAFSTCPNDPRNIGSYIGMGMASAGVGALIGPPISGAMISMYGGYDAVCLFSGAMSLFGGLFAFACKATTKEGLWGRV